MAKERLKPHEPAMSDSLPRVRVEAWADVVCPFCWIGKAHLDDAARRLGIEGELEVVHRAFQLNPDAKESRPLREYLAERFGGPEGARVATTRVRAMGQAVGLAFDQDRAVYAPTLDAHRLVLHAQETRGAAAGVALLERLYRAHHAEGQDVGDRETLRRLAAEAGMSAVEAERVLGSDLHAARVRADQQEAHALGARGVPLFVLDRRLAVSGAQPVDAFEEALRRARAARSRALP